MNELSFAFGPKAPESKQNKNQFTLE